MANLAAILDKEASAEIEAVLSEAQGRASEIVAKAKEEAQTEADKIVAQAQATIESEKKAAMADLKGQVAGLSVEIAEKVVRKELADKGKQLELVESMLGDVTLN